MNTFTLLLCLQLQVPDPFNAELAYRWAPVHYQDTDNTHARADYISRFDYDGDWKGDNNWENLDKNPQSAWVYYSVVESETHWFIVYAFYHPRDWTDAWCCDQEHENDLEGLMLSVRKNGQTYGALEAMVTVAHTDYYSYVPENSALTNGKEDIDGKISMQLYDNAWHPKTCQEAKGHGLKAWPFAGDFQGKDNEDGIIYYPSKNNAQIPSSGNDRNVAYRLVSITEADGMWSKQMLEASKTRAQSNTFAKWGAFKGNDEGSCGDGLTITCATDSANAPWGWDDSNDGPNYKGTLALDPAALMYYYFKGLGSFSLRYTSNIYLQNLRAAGYSDSLKPNGWPSALKLSQLYKKLK